jgi:hypothetical protein
MCVWILSTSGDCMGLVAGLLGRRVSVVGGGAISSSPWGVVTVLPDVMSAHDVVGVGTVSCLGRRLWGHAWY